MSGWNLERGQGQKSAYEELSAQFESALRGEQFLPKCKPRISSWAIFGSLSEGRYRQFLECGLVLA
jgi:hypothetical protein